MELTGVGGGLMLAIAAALWLAYLVPNWFKRREYLATERNAVRLQQTIRVLAETAEVPPEVRAEAAARRLAQQQRAEYRQGPVSVGRPVQRPAPAPDLRLATLRLRRTRAVTALVLLAALVTVVVQIGAMLVGGAVFGSWVVLVLGLGASFGALATLGRLADVSRSRREVPQRPARRTSLGARPPQRQPQPTVAWTPVPMPKPLYLSRDEAPARPAHDPEFELAVAAQAAERALRDAERALPVVDAPAAPQKAPSKFASMGIVDAARPAAPDLDAVLARRRAV